MTGFRLWKFTECNCFKLLLISLNFEHCKWKWKQNCVLSSHMWTHRWMKWICYKFASLQETAELQNRCPLVYLLDSMTKQLIVCLLVCKHSLLSVTWRITQKMSFGMDNQTPSSDLIHIQSQLDAPRSFVSLALPFWFYGFWTPDDNKMKARAWWNTIRLLRLSLMDDISLLWGSTPLLGLTQTYKEP